MKITGKTSSEIFDCVRYLVQSQQLQYGDSLPPVRDLAMMLEVNRNTVASAYKRLVNAGIAVTQGRLGTFIRNTLGPGEQEGSLQGSPLIDLASGNPNPEWLPDPFAIRPAFSYRARLYGEPTLNERLEDLARRWFTGDCPDALEINLAHGAVDAIERLVSSYLVAGDKMAVENPCFLSSINTLRLYSVQALGVAVDNEGMQASSLDAVLAKGVQAVLITPRAHNPTGCSLSKKRAKALRQVLEKYPHVLVIVDDHFALLANGPYHSVIPASTQRWALIRSVSKGLGPDLRVALVASDPETSQRLRLHLAPGTTWVSHMLQDIVEACLTSQDIVEQLARAREDYAYRRDGLINALAKHGVAVTTPADGLNLWMPLAQDSQPLVLSLAQRGWLVRSGETFSVHEIVQGLRITISTLNEPQANRLASDIRRCLDNS